MLDLRVYSLVVDGQGWATEYGFNVDGENSGLGRGSVAMETVQINNRAHNFFCLISKSYFAPIRQELPII